MTSDQIGTTLHEEHAHLRDLLVGIQQMLTTRNVAADKLAAMFCELAEHVMDHFQHEEAGGYFCDAIEIAPRLSERADALLAQHPEMVRQLADLQQHVVRQEMSGGWWQAMNEQFSLFVERFQIHEAAETALIQEAYTDDIGAED